MPKSSGELEQLYSLCRQQLFTCALVITGSPALAEDAIHEAFCKLLRTESQTRELKAYVFRAVRNAALDQSRRHKSNMASLPEVIFDPRPQPALAAEDAEFQRAIIELMQQLSADERETIVEHLYGDLTFQEIAKVREVPLGTITSWYRRGVDKLRRKLEIVDGSV